MYELTLFAGAGGGLLGSRLLGWQTICYVENNRYCVQVLKARIKDGYLDNAPIWDDVRSFDGVPWTGLVDVISAGFPCQPFSRAGKMLGESDERNLWPDTIRIIRQVRPRFALLENTSSLVSHPYFGTILGDLSESGYDAQWDCIPASAIGANHQRDRVWIVAHAICDRQRIGKIQPKQIAECSESPDVGDDGKKNVVADANQKRGKGISHEPQWTQPCARECSRHELQMADSDEGRCRQSHSKQTQSASVPCGRFAGICDPARDGRITWWDAEPGMGRVVNGLAHRVDRLKALGNGQVPAVVEAAWTYLFT